ncbi:PadR family transcriptional regulator [Candidatus Bathycorpusculum sp.]|uniref:PadR family transcriptional regulator n=1 Tax=Candidatus Bathycorpusculum sp. TaxID=2994959 RepID=UPI00281EDB74|nr:PadR family transcriptional regulator [Candidatus Termitimicrobium sp.]
MTPQSSLKPHKLLTDFNRLYILTQLYSGPQYGYQLISSAQTTLKKNLSPSAVYPFLEQLETNGYLTHTTTLIGERQRKTYQLTPKGQMLCLELFSRFSEIFAPAFSANNNSKSNPTQ